MTTIKDGFEIHESAFVQRLIKLARIFRSSRFYNSGLSTISSIVMVCLHWTACVWGMVREDDDENDWIHLGGLQNSEGEKYLEIPMVMGYGDFHTSSRV